MARPEPFAQNFMGGTFHFRKLNWFILVVLVASAVGVVTSLRFFYDGFVGDSILHRVCRWHRVAFLQFH
jgi:hypothetical protein